MSIAFVPAVILRLMFGKAIKANRFTPEVVATSFIIGEVEDMRWQDALKVGLVQCLAMIPGTSRSGATIIGGMLLGLLFSFISAWLCIRWLLRYISSHSFVPFAWYRIAFGLLVLATAWSGLVTWAA